MNPQFYSILHVFSVIVLTAHTFMAFANPTPENRKRTMMITGIASLLILISGFGMISKIYANHFAGWMFVKLFCWLVLSALAGMAYRKVHLRGVLSVVALSVILLALLMVYLKPF